VIQNYKTHINYGMLVGMFFLALFFKCNSHVSEPPKDICLYEFQYISDAAGGERPRKTDEKFISPKQVLLCFIPFYF
jgi:hypothetical protein